MTIKICCLLCLWNLDIVHRRRTPTFNQMRDIQNGCRDQYSPSDSFTTLLIVFMGNSNTRVRYLTQIRDCLSWVHSVSATLPQATTESYKICNTARITRTNTNYLLSASYSCSLELLKNILICLFTDAWKEEEICLIKNKRNTRWSLRPVLGHIR